MTAKSQKRKWRTIKNPACESEKFTVKEVIRVVKGHKKRNDESRR